MKPSIYCIYNSCYDYYGQQQSYALFVDDVLTNVWTTCLRHCRKAIYKLGCTIDIDKRICGFVTRNIFIFR